MGIRTIGYGTACHAFDCSKIKAPISEAQAAAIMIQDLKAKYYGTTHRLIHFLSGAAFAAAHA